MGRRGRDVDQIEGFDRVEPVAEADVAAAGEHDDRMGVLVAFEPGGLAGGDLEEAQLARQPRVAFAHQQAARHPRPALVLPVAAHRQLRPAPLAPAHDARSAFGLAHRGSPSTSARRLGRGALDVALAEQAAAEQEDGVVAVGAPPAADLRPVHAAAEHREGRAQPAERPAQVVGDRETVAEREDEAAAGVRVDRPVAAGDPEEIPPDQRGREAVAPAEQAAGQARVAEQREPARRRDLRDAVETDEQRRDERGAAPAARARAARSRSVAAGPVRLGR